MSDLAIRVENPCPEHFDYAQCKLRRRISKLYPSSFDFPFGSAQGMAQDAQDRPHWQSAKTPRYAERRDWKLEIRDWRLEIGNWKERLRSGQASNVQSFDFAQDRLPTSKDTIWALKDVSFESLSRGCRGITRGEVVGTLAPQCAWRLRLLRIWRTISRLILQQCMSRERGRFDE